jgi:hypothetical protein
MSLMMQNSWVLSCWKKHFSWGLVKFHVHRDPWNESFTARLAKAVVCKRS